jgi:hypothetical protein
MPAAAAAVVGLVLWRGRKVERKHVVATIIAIPAAFGLMVLADSIRSGGAQSHVGRAAHLLVSGGFGEFMLIVERKLEMNIKLIQYSPWSKLLIASVVSAAIVFRTERFDVPERLRLNRDVHSGVIAAGVGTVAALLLNDSGVVAAATAFLFVWTAIVLTALAVPQEKGQGVGPLPAIEQSDPVR